MPDVHVVSRSVDAVVDITVSAPYSGDGADVDYSDPSLSLTLQSISPTSTIYGAQDALYRVDQGDWIVLPPGAKHSVAIDLSTQTLTMKRAQFAADIQIRMTVTGVPSGLYAGDRALSAAVSAPALAALGVYAPVEIILSKENILSLGPGQIISLSIASGGTGYAVNDVVTVNIGGNNTAYFPVASEIGGVVTGLGPTDTPGNSYSVISATDTTAITGVGTGLTVNILAAGAPFTLIAPAAAGYWNRVIDATVIRVDGEATPYANSGGGLISIEYNNNTRIASGNSNRDSLPLSLLVNTGTEVIGVQGDYQYYEDDLDVENLDAKPVTINLTGNGVTDAGDSDLTLRVVITYQRQPI